MDPVHLGQRVTRLARSRVTRRAALATGGAGLATTLLDRLGVGPGRVLAQDATPAAATAGANLPPEVPAWMQTPGAPASAYGERAPAEEAVVRWSPAPDVSFSPLADLHGTLTPNALFYEVHYGGIPAIDPAEHRLLVHGLVERPTLFTMDDLKRFPSVSRGPFPGVLRQLLLPVAGRIAGRDRPADRRLDQLRRMDRACRWRPSCARSGSSRAAAWMLAEGADAAGHDRSIPVGKAMHDGLLAYAANGEDLRPSQGYPRAPAAARLRRQHQRQVAAPAEGRAPDPGRPGRRRATTPI